MPSRSTQFVATKAQGKTVTQWILNEVEQSRTSHGISLKAVGQFPNVFKEESRRASLEKARMWFTQANH